MVASSHNTQRKIGRRAKARSDNEAQTQQTRWRKRTSHHQPPPPQPLTPTPRPAWLLRTASGAWPGKKPDAPSASTSCSFPNNPALHRCPPSIGSWPFPFPPSPPTFTNHLALSGRPRPRGLGWGSVASSSGCCLRCCLLLPQLLRPGWDRGARGAAAAARWSPGRAAEAQRADSGPRAPRSPASRSGSSSRRSCPGWWRASTGGSARSTAKVNRQRAGEGRRVPRLGQRFPAPQATIDTHGGGASAQAATGLLLLPPGTLMGSGHRPGPCPQRCAETAVTEHTLGRREGAQGWGFQVRPEDKGKSIREGARQKGSCPPDCCAGPACCSARLATAPLPLRPLARPCRGLPCLVSQGCEVSRPSRWSQGASPCLAGGRDGRQLCLQVCGGRQERDLGQVL